MGATQNLLLAAVAAQGETVLRGAAREPEVVDLIQFLTACGAQIAGMGTGELKIQGGRPLLIRNYGRQIGRASTVVSY